MTTPKMTPNEMLATIAKLQAENERLAQEAAKKAAQGDQPIRISVSAKGAVSVYGLGQFPVTLYGKQWKKLLAAAKDVQAFVEQAEALGALATKGQPFQQPKGLAPQFVAKEAKADPKAGNGL